MASPCFPAEAKKSDVDKALTTDRVVAIWRYAKANFIDKGVSFEDTLTNMADVTGMPRDWVAKAFTKPKALREVTNEVYKQQEARRNAIRDAKFYVATVDAPAALKLLTTLTSIPRRVLTLGHGPVFPVTHALDLAGSEPATYFKTVANAWKFASKASHAASMDWLRNHDLYPTARRSGLEVDPEKGPSGILSGGSGGWARRSWDALKVGRMQLFEDRWNALPEGEKTIAAGKDLASQINHSTGVMSPSEWGFGGLSKGMFAPQLTASKIAKTFVDPAKTIGTYFKVATGEDVPFAERNVASLRVKKAATALASYVGLLAVNEGLLQASGSDDHVNFKNYGDSDWLRPKFAGHTINLRGTSELIRLLGSLVAIGSKTQQERHGESKTDQARTAVAKYAQYKIDPLLQLVGEAAYKEDTFGRPLPWSNEKGTATKPKYTGTEYALSKGPIFFGGATKEVYDTMREHGLSAADSTSLLRGLAVGASEFLGGGVQPIREPKSKPSY